MTKSDIKILLLLQVIATYLSWWAWQAHTTPIPPLKPPSIEAHPGIMSTIHRSRFAQIQALLDANVPIIDAKDLTVNQDGGTIYFPDQPRIPMQLRNITFTGDLSGYPIIYIGATTHASRP